jgi:hypothetical protein
MKTLSVLVALAAMLSVSVWAAEAPKANPTGVTLQVGGKKISAQFPQDVSSVVQLPQEHPTFVQGTRGNESMAIGKADDFDIYSIQVFDPILLSKHGHEASVADLKAFVTQEMEHYKKEFQFDRIEKKKQVPESLQNASSKTDEYVLVFGSYNKEKKRAGKLFLWRVLLVGGQLVMVQRDIGTGYYNKRALDLTKTEGWEKEWDFLKSVTITE